MLGREELVPDKPTKLEVRIILRIGYIEHIKNKKMTNAINMLKVWII